MEKNNIQNLLLNIGRKIVREKGSEYLTVRKLSEASGCSVGAIYNQFANMDNFIVLQNYKTLEILAQRLEKVKRTDNPYVDMEQMLKCFVDYVESNKNLWFLLYDFYLKHSDRMYSVFYLRQLVRIVVVLKSLIRDAVPDIETPEQILSAQVLGITMFSLSSLLTKNVLNNFAKVDKMTICQILLNSYVAGLTVLENKNQN